MYWVSNTLVMDDIRSLKNNYYRSVSVHLARHSVDRLMANARLIQREASTFALSVALLEQLNEVISYLHSSVS